MNKSCYKCCAVPMCRSTSISTPQKLFINIPKKAEVRKKWLTLARRDPASLTTTSTSHFCEDHFDLPNDMANYIEYTTMGVVSRIKMRPDCLPTKFACQPRRASTSTDVCQPAAAKRQRLSLVNESEEEMRPAAFQQSDNIDTVLPSQDKGPVIEEQNFSKSDKATQAYITSKYRSKTTQTITVSHTKQTSPMKVYTRSVSTSPFKISQFKPQIKPIPSSSSRTWNISSDKSDSDISFYTPSVSNVSKTSSDTISSNETEWKKDCIKKSMVEHTVDKIKKRPQFYIGVPRDCYFLVNLIHEHTGITELKILLCLKKIRLDSKFSELADEFQMSTSYASKIFSQNITKIAEVMRPFIVELDKPSIKRCLPIAFRKNYFNVTCIIDCLEIEIQKPSKALHQALTWSEYKKANTIKYLISSTPNGVINYISRGYGGRISDVCLVENCDFLNSLPTRSHVMADRGFKHIESLLLGVGCRLIRPPSTVSDNKLTKEEVNETKKIASLRIHIERVIRRIREFSFLKPHACINNYLLGKLDDVIVIACGLINLQASLINK